MQAPSVNSRRYGASANAYDHSHGHSRNRAGVVFSAEATAPLRVRHRLEKFLLRHGRRPPERMTPWTQRPLAWIKQAVQFEQLLEFILALLDQRLEVTIVLLEGDVVFLEQLQQLTAVSYTHLTLPTNREV